MPDKSKLLKPMPSIPVGYMLYERSNEGEGVLTPLMTNFSHSIYPTILMAKEIAIYRVAQMRKSGFLWFTEKDIIIVEVRKEGPCGEIIFKSDWTQKEIIAHQKEANLAFERAKETVQPLRAHSSLPS